MSKATYVAMYVHTPEITLLFEISIVGYYNMANA
jgi:hypothetical protein